MHLPGVKIEEDEELGELTHRQEAFVREYVKDYNGTQAAIRAGYSEVTAGQAASRLLKFRKIATAIRFAKQDLLDKSTVDRQWILERLMRVADTQMSDVASWGPDEIQREDRNGVVHVSNGVSLIPSSELTRAASYSVMEIGNTKEGVKIKLADKNAALMNIAKLVGLVTDKVEHGGKIETSGPDLTKMTPEQLIAYETFLMSMAKSNVEVDKENGR